MKNAVIATDVEAQYDDKAKRLLGHKYILAYILIKTIDEFAGMSPQDVVPFIEGEPYISVVPMELGLTNAMAEYQGQRIVCLNSENSEINEGMIWFDIVFYVRMKDGLSQIIVNVEAQKSEPVKYDILNRAIFYVSRLVSSQKERDFVNSNYNDIKRVFSIWICMNVDEDCMDYVHLTNDKLVGNYQWKGRLDLLNIVMIGLSNELPGYDEQYELHRLLGALLSMDLTVEEKLNIIEAEYNIPVEDNMRKDVSVMCNLSQRILEEGIERGIEKGKAEVIITMYKSGYALEDIANIINKDEEEIKAIIQREELTLV